MSEKHVMAVENMKLKDEVAKDGTKISADILRIILLTLAEVADENGVCGKITLRDVEKCLDGKYRFRGWENDDLSVIASKGNC